jgi:heterodisulfide reductase subunit A-like polyferredoxin
MVIKGEDIVGDRLIEFPVDMVLLAVGLEPAAGNARLAESARHHARRRRLVQRARLQRRPDRHRARRHLRRRRLSGPKDIPDTVAQASAVAAGCSRRSRPGGRRQPPAEPVPRQIERAPVTSPSRLAREEAVWRSASTPS